MKGLFALTILEIINLEFGSSIGQNPDCVSLTNRKGNTIYVFNKGDKIEISAYKVSARCYNKTITSDSELHDVRNSLISKLKLS